MEKIFLLIFLFLSAGCSDMDLPELPDSDSCIEDAQTLDLDIAETQDETPDESLESRLVTAVVGGYDVPYSGKVYISDNEDMSALNEIAADSGMGASDGADLAVSTWDGGFFVLGRYNSSTVYFFDEKDDRTGFNFRETALGYDTALNLQDGVYNSFLDEFMISSLNSNKLIILNKNGISGLELSKNVNASPARMRIIGKKLFVALQNLNDQWQSESGQIAVIDLPDHTVKLYDLPVKDPVGKIEYNENVDPDHFYIACSGSWQKRDGALVRVDLDTMGAVKVLSEGDDGGLLDGDFVDLSIADNGIFYIVFSNNNDGWINKLLKYNPGDGSVSEIDSGINAFASNPIDFSTVTKKIYYFADSGPDTFLKLLNTLSGEKEEKKMEAGPAAVKIWIRKINIPKED